MRKTKAEREKLLATMEQEEKQHDDRLDELA